MFVTPRDARESRLEIMSHVRDKNRQDCRSRLRDTLLRSLNVHSSARSYVQRPPEELQPLSRLASGQTNDLGSAEGREGVHESDAHVEFGRLAVWVFRGDAFSEGLEAAHLCLDLASGMVSSPTLPEGPSVVPSGAHGLVSGDCGWAVLCSRASVLADIAGGGVNSTLRMSQVTVSMDRWTLCH